MYFNNLNNNDNETEVLDETEQSPEVLDENETLNDSYPNNTYNQFSTMANPSATPPKKDGNNNLSPPQ